MDYYEPNYYPDENYRTEGDCYPLQYAPNPPALQPNRFIYVKQNFAQPPQPIISSKVLINPLFNKKVYLNPQFQQIQQNAPIKPKIHLNPNFVKPQTSILLPPAASPPPQATTKPNNAKPVRTVIATRTKIVRVPLKTPTKYVRKKRISINSKYKLVRSNGVKNQFKLDKRKTVLPTAGNRTLNRSIKKKYVYVNWFLSISTIAKNVLLKKNATLRKGFVDINGILFKKSPNSLRKAPTINSTLVKAGTSRRSGGRLANGRKSLVKRFKVVRARKVSLSQLKKCNIPCEIYRRTGKCKRKELGKCIKVHNADQIVLCTRFLQGACLKENCLFSHKVSLEKMPTCKYYLEGLCSRDGCPYLHVKMNPKAPICRQFLEGFCDRGSQCDQRHQFLCPEYEKGGACARRQCPYPHGDSVRKPQVIIKPIVVAKKCSIKRNSQPKRKHLANAGDLEARYYIGRDSSIDQMENINADMRDRPKLGELPAFIPFSDTS